ncbi:hypothetical protein L2X99_12790 [Microbacterium sp. KUDC0406]|uniref:hypothetical protein n=1 Tax=Microbacterium sp. KUDC0406 TaxID=2909588 RepID=UPI001F320FF7|nr:hypothetical protein [Microbacterium sp. KUDC0406]UJP09305.1 hypothetical protein L2X99_12790 [Microbacterium sp. KUDC0406]
MDRLSDTEILAAIRPLLEMTAERAVHASTAERLRNSVTESERIERNTAGQRVAEIDREIAERLIQALDRIGPKFYRPQVDQLLALFVGGVRCAMSCLNLDQRV